MRKALVVDDNSANLYMLKILLEKEGFDVISSENGKDALEKARRNPPDLIVSDILMPVMDGYALCRKCKTDKKLKSVPFVFYTATYTSEKDEQFALSLGADRFIIKPQEPEVLIKILISLMDEKPAVKREGLKSPGELSFLRQHNEILFHKLEKKIADLEAANQQFRDSAEMLLLIKKAVECSSDAISISDPRGNLLYHNRASVDLFEYTQEELQDAGGFLVLYENREIGRKVHETIRNGNSWTGELMMISRSGRKIPIILNADSIKDESGKIIGLIQVHTDVTSLQQAEDALKMSEEKYRDLVKYAPAGIYEVDYETGRFKSVNDVICEYTGYTRDELLNINFSSIFTEESLKLLGERLEKLSANERIPSTVEYSIRTKNGDKLWILLSAQYIYAAGKLKEATGVIYNITDRKRAEKVLLENETKYRLLADHMKDLVWLMDMDLKGKYISPSVEKLLGYTIDELQNSPIFKLATPPSVKAALDFFSTEMPKALEAPPNYSLKRFLEAECRSKDGRTVWLEASFSLIRNENGTPVSILGEARDITERKQAEEKLQHTLESLKRAVGTTIQVLVNALESKDPYTAGHQSRSANLASAIATEMGLDANKIEGIRMASSIHDIGKLSVPAEILTKPTKLLDIEFSLIKEHSEKGYEMLKDVESDWPLAEIIYQHHERMNGSGYPRNLKVDDILLESRILAVADVVEAMGSHRPYRPALGIKIALEEIEKNKGILYDADVADACLRLFREKGYALP